MYDADEGEAFLFLSPRFFLLPSRPGEALVLRGPREMGGMQWDLPREPKGPGGEGQTARWPEPNSHVVLPHRYAI